MWFESLPLAILRCSLSTAAAAMLAAVGLRWLHVRSPRVHRLAWCGVVLQGWLMFPCEVRLPILPAGEERQRAVDLATVDLGEFDRVDELDKIAAAQSTLMWTPAANRDEGARTPDWATPALVIAGAWAMGLLACAGLYAWRFVTMTHHLPLGHAPDCPAWCQEWSRVKSQSGVRRNVELRVTRDVGPLLCFVPFAYFVLTPRRLWCRLSSDERTAVLRHELAHLARGDLWKSLAVRVLALPQWFNPAVWLAVRRFEEAAEWAADDMVHGRRTDDRLSYAAALVRLGDYVAPRAMHTVSARGGSLTRRVERLVFCPIMEDRMMKKLIVFGLVVVFSLVSLLRVELVAQESHAVEELPATPAIHESEELAPAATDAANEDFARTGLKPYCIEPPDILLIEAVKIVPKSSYYTARLDVEAAEGEARRQVQGEKLVRPDGSINLGRFGSVNVAGMTLSEARTAIELQLAKEADKAEVIVDVIAYNSKFAYVIVDRETGGDEAHRIPITGNETVLDAIATVEGVSRNRQTHLYVGRPTTGTKGRDQILEVDWTAIVRGDSRTNYQLLPGDRLVISEKRTGPNTGDETVGAKTAEELIAAEEELHEYVDVLEKSIRLAETNQNRRTATRQQLEAVEKAYEAGTVTLDLLLDAQRRALEAENSYIEGLVELKRPDTPRAKVESDRLLALFQLKHVRSARDRSLETWKKVREKYEDEIGAEFEEEAQAREQYYLFRAACEEALVDFTEADAKYRQIQDRTASPYYNYQE